MTPKQAFFCGILYWLAEANVPYVTIWTLQRPLVCGWIAGTLLGAPLEGAVCGALISLLYIGHRSQGSSMPGDIALAGICAAAACCCGLSSGASVFFALPAGLFGILIWKLRLHVNIYFAEQVRAGIHKGQTWAILRPGILFPVLFSAALCIPVGAFSAFFSFSAASWLMEKQFLSASLLPLPAAAGIILCGAGMISSLSPLRHKGPFLAFLAGFLIMPLMRIPLAVLLIPALVLSFLAACLENRKTAAARGSAPEEDFPDPDLDPDFMEETDSWSADADHTENASYYDAISDPDCISEKKSAEHLRSPELPYSLSSLAACNLLWILFVQAAYNTRLMMGQAAAAAFLPLLKELYPDDPKARQDVLSRQCVYLNTQPELGSCLIGCLAALEGRRAGLETDGRIKTVRSSIMGIFGALGDELFQCAWIPILLLPACDLVLRDSSPGPIVLLYTALAVLSGALLSSLSFYAGITGGEMKVLDLLEGSLFHRIRHALELLLPFLKGAALGTLMLRCLIPFFL